MIWLALFLLTACGDNGNQDTILTGFSGIVIFGTIAWIAYRYVKGRT